MLLTDAENHDSTCCIGTIHAAPVQVPTSVDANMFRRNGIFQPESPSPLSFETTRSVHKHLIFHVEFLITQISVTLGAQNLGSVVSHIRILPAANASTLSVQRSARHCLFDCHKNISTGFHRLTHQRSLEVPEVDHKISSRLWANDTFELLEREIRSTIRSFWTRSSNRVGAYGFPRRQGRKEQESLGMEVTIWIFSSTGSSRITIETTVLNRIQISSMMDLLCSHK